MITDDPASVIADPSVSGGASVTPSTSGSGPTPFSTPAYDVSAVTLKLPPFWPADPEIWFAQVEVQFACRRITSQRRRFDHVVSSLSPEFAVEVRDLILRPPSDDPYRILDRSDRSYKLDLNGRTDSVSIDRLKPAHIDFPIAVDTRMSSSSTSPTTTPPSQPTLSDTLSEDPATRTTRSSVGQPISGISLPSHSLKGE